jgi:hypothetical protein
MTPEEIREGNISIASFLGEVREVWKFNKQSTLGWFGETALKYRRELMRMTIGEAILVEHLQFHASFDWLMPVVEKIERIYDDFHGYFGVYISSNSCTIQGTNLRTTPDNPHYAYHNEVTLNTKIESTWYAVVQFIKWYNTQQ